MSRFTDVLLTLFALIGLASAAPNRPTDCERRRLEELQSTRNLTGIVVPECDEHGEYRPMQCFGDAIRGGRPYCACYDREFGQIKGPSRKLLSCNCIRRHHDWTNNRGLERGYEPRCNSTTGQYDPAQCNSTHHWCVHEETGNQYGYERVGGCSTDLSRLDCGHDAFRGEPGSHQDDHELRETSSSHGGSTEYGDTSGQGSSSSLHHTGTSNQAESAQQDDPSLSVH